MLSRQVDGACRNIPTYGEASMCKEEGPYTDDVLLVERNNSLASARELGRADLN